MKREWRVWVTPAGQKRDLPHVGTAQQEVDLTRGDVWGGAETQRPETRVPARAVRAPKVIALFFFIIIKIFYLFI